MAAKDVPASLTIRLARAEDAVALLELAVIDNAPQLEGEVLIAEVDGRPLAALELAGGRVVADPFRRTAQLVELLRVRARALLDGPAETNRKRRAGLYAGPARWSTR
jgi:hypothetical protein